MSLFNAKTIKLELSGRDQTVELKPIPLGAYNAFQAKFKEFQKLTEIARESGTDEDGLKSIESIADLLATYIVGATKEDILNPDSGLDMEDVGYILGKLLQASQNPKV